MADKKFAQEVPKIATLEARKIGLNRQILILFAVSMSEEKVFLIKLKKVRKHHMTLVNNSRW